MSVIVTCFLFLLVLLTSKYTWGYIVFYIIVLVHCIRIGFGTYYYNKSRLYITYLVIPQLFVLLSTFIGVVFYGDTFFVFRGFQFFLLPSSAYIFAYCLFVLHKHDSVKIIFINLIFYYLFKIINVITEIGFFQMVKKIKYIGNGSLSKWLEQHDIGVSVGMIVLYYLFFSKKKRLRPILLSIMIMILCWKRAGIYALLLTIAYSLLYLKKKKRQHMQLLTGLLGIVCSLAYVILVRGGVWIKILFGLGIHPMGRNIIYSLFENYYSISPLFIGRGSGFTSKLLTLWMRNGNVTVIATNALGLHNDILRIYIECGFGFFMIWCAYYLIVLPGVLRRINKEMSDTFFIMTIYAFIVYLVDNTTTYTLFQTIYALIPLSMFEYGDEVCQLN